MGVKIRVRRGVVHLVITFGGVRSEISTGLHTSSDRQQNKEVMATAEIMRSRKEVEIISHANGLEVNAQRVTLYDYCVQCQKDAGATSKMYKMLPYLQKFGGQTVLLSAVTHRWYEIFQTKMRDESGLGSAAAERYSCYLRQCLARAVRDSLLLTNPSKGIKHLSVAETDREPLTIEEVRLMLQTPYDRSSGRGKKMSLELISDIRKAFIFSCVTGLRIVDLTQLSWDKIDLGRRQLGKVQQKTKSTVWVPLNSDAYAILDDGETHAPEEKVFPRLSLTRTTTNRYITGWAHAAGITKHVTWHIARYTDATLLFDSGADLYTVQKLLGHKKIQTTQHYARISDQKKRDAVDSLPSLDDVGHKKDGSIAAPVSESSSEDFKFKF